jgi:tetratricopeptide (TPR) repeat protein
MGTEPLLTRPDDNGAAHERDVARFDRTPPEDAGGEARLDEAMRRADDLLLRSLRDDEAARRRGRRRRAVLWSAGVGAFAMILAITAILLGLVGSAGAPRSSERAAALAQEGWALWQKGDAEAAQAKFASAVELDPKNANNWNGLGWSRLNTGKRKEAQAAFAQAVKLQPNHPAALNGLGQTALLLKQYDEAEKYLLKAAPTAPAAYYGLARLYLLQGKYDEAAKWADKALAQAPDDEGMKRVAEAAHAKRLDDDLRRMIEPEDEAATSESAQRGWELLNRGMQREAVEAFEAALKSNPNDLTAHNGLGFALLNSGNVAEARPHFEACLKLNPNALGAMNGLARCLKAEGKTGEAVALWEQLVKKAPGVNAGTVGLAQTYFEEKQYDKAVPYLEQLVKADPKDPDARRKLEAARKALGKS